MQTPALNPRYPESSKIVRSVKQIDVLYMSFDGSIESSTIEVHEDAVDNIRAFFAKALELNFPIQKVGISSDYDWDDDILMQKNITSSFNYRNIAGTSRLSLHSHGLAIDVNPLFNPYISYLSEEPVVSPQGAVHDTSRPGTLFAAHPLVAFMKHLGWEWGGDWLPESGRTDFQHFQKQIDASNTVQ